MDLPPSVSIGEVRFVYDDETRTWWIYEPGKPVRGLRSIAGGTPPAPKDSFNLLPWHRIRSYQLSNQTLLQNTQQAAAALYYRNPASHLPPEDNATSGDPIRVIVYFEPGAVDPTRLRYGWQQALDVPVAQPETLLPWSSRSVAQPYIYQGWRYLQHQDFVSNAEIQLPWSSRSVQQPYIYQGQRYLQHQDFTSNDETPPSWKPRPIDAFRLPPYWLYAWNVPTDVPPPPPPQPDTLAPWAARPIPIVPLPPYWLYQWTSVSDVPAVVQEPGRESWIPRYVQGPPPPIRLYYTHADVTGASVVPVDPHPWRSQWVRIEIPPVWIHYLLRCVATSPPPDTGTGASNQPPFIFQRMRQY